MSSPVRLAIVNDYEIVVSGLASMLEEHRDRVHVVEINAQTPVLSDVDVVLVDTFGQLPRAGSLRTSTRPPRRTDSANGQAAAGSSSSTTR